MRRGLGIVPALAFAALAGCGSDDPAPAAAGPAAVAPAGATVYAEAVLRPEGEQREALDQALSLLLDTGDPGGFVVDEVDEALAESDAGVSYEVDIEPWLGERGALFFTELFPAGSEDSQDAEGPQGSEGSGPSLGEGGERGAFLVEVTDADAAASFVEVIAAQQGDTEARSYEDVDYRLDEDGVAGGVVGDHLVFGDEPTFREVVDTEAGGPALAGEEEFASAIEGAAEAAVNLYVDVPGIVAAADSAGELSGSDRRLLESILAGFADAPLTAALEAEPNALALELAHGAAEAPLLSAPGESSALRELPRDSWLALGFNDLGAAVASLFEHGGELGIGAGALERAQRRFQLEYGLRLEDFYGPLGDGAVFALGRGIFGAGGGVVLEAESPGAAARLLGGLSRGLASAGETVRPLRSRESRASGFAITVPDAPGSLNFVASGRRIVIAYGDRAAAAALEPGETLEANPEFAAASAALGERFSVGFFLDFAPLVELLDFAAVAEPSLREAMPYLESVDFLVAGSAEDGRLVRQRLVLALAAAVEGPAT